MMMLLLIRMVLFFTVIRSFKHVLFIPIMLGEPLPGQNDFEDRQREFIREIVINLVIAFGMIGFNWIVLKG